MNKNKNNNKINKNKNNKNKIKSKNNTNKTTITTKTATTLTLLGCDSIEINLVFLFFKDKMYTYFFGLPLYVCRTRATINKQKILWKLVRLKASFAFEKKYGGKKERERLSKSDLFNKTLSFFLYIFQQPMDWAAWKMPSTT